MNRAECYRMVHKLVLILINHTHNIYHNLNAHISIRVSAASAHQQHRRNSKIGALAASAHQHHQQQEVLADLKMSERK